MKDRLILCMSVYFIVFFNLTPPSKVFENLNVGMFDSFFLDFFVSETAVPILRLTFYWQEQVVGIFLHKPLRPK